jgi:hypothetical protein
MGRKLIKDQIFDRYKQMFDSGFGRSRHADKASNQTVGRIYSYKTFSTYREVGKKFGVWLRQEHPEIKKLDKVDSRIVNEYLVKRAYTDSVSNWTFKTEKSALAKLFGVEHLRDNERHWIESPECKRVDVVRSRSEVVRDAHFSESKNAEIVEFCRSTGLRRHELEALVGNKLSVRSDGVYLQDIAGKGGKIRDVRVVGDVELVKRLCEEAGSGKVFDHVHNACDVHGYRADYAKRVYEATKRDLSDLNKSEMFYCRGDKKGVIYDRVALEEVSKNLGHNRIQVVSSSYLR